MITRHLAESTVEQAALDWFRELDYAILYGPDIEPEKPGAERASFSEVVLAKLLRAAIARLNPHIPTDAREDAMRKALRFDHPSLIENNQRFHRFVVEGVPVEYRAKDRIVHDHVELIDFANLDNNDWLVVNEFTVIEDRHQRRPDIVVFVNGLPLAVFELKNPADAVATVRDAFQQLQTYKVEIPSLFVPNQVLLASDGTEARIGTISSNWERFMPWRTVEGNDLASPEAPQLEILLKGVFEKARFLELIRHFIVFEQTRQGPLKKLAGYHQFHAVRKALEKTVAAARSDHRAGVVWHTQGAGKSLTMVFYAGKLAQQPELENPTIVVITDRNDLDDQLFDTFAACSDVLRQTPLQAESRADLREKLQVASGGIVFTTVQKFLPEAKGDTLPRLSDRPNIVIIADEAHRSQYDFIDGFARHLRGALPNATFIGFTATPIALKDRNTVAVFGDTIDTYDIHQSIEDGATVRIYYEPRLAKLELDRIERPKIDPEFDEVTEGEEDSVKRELKSKWARMEALVGAGKRLRLVAQDIVDHFENRLEAMEGKGLIVCMSRRICVQLYDELVRLRPQWADPGDDKGFLKVIMTGSASDPLEWQQHVRDKARRKRIGDLFRDPASPIRLVIVRDMWLTGFDVPSLHTMYADKPMRNHGLMQAIARVNRVFRDKPGGLVVDYLGLAHELKIALAKYSERDRGLAGVPQERAVAVMKEKEEIVRAMFHGFDYSSFFRGAATERVRTIPGAMDHILRQEDGKARFLKAVSDLSKAFALAVPHEDAIAIRDELAFFQAIRAAFLKYTEREGRDPYDLDSAVQQLVSRAVASDKVIDIFQAAGLKRPDISILSDEFLEEVKGMPQRNLALEVLRKLISDDLRTRSRKFLVQSKTFSQMLEETIRRYHNRAIDAAEVIEELLVLAKEMKDAQHRGEDMNLTDEEMAFYDALETNDSAVKVLGDDTLRAIARELVESVKRNVTIDWTVKESSRARLRVLVRRILRKHGYPPDKQEKATLTVLEQAALLGNEWATATEAQ